MFYTKYRPQTFSEVLKPNEAVDVLVSQIKSKKVAHAYLLVGSRGTGKTTTARILAKALNCLELDKNGDPCDKCANCMAIKTGSFIDLIEIDAASNRGIDDIRDLREKVRLAPTMGNKKVYIIDEVHMLSTDAFNAFLKTLEEPPANVVFILCTTELHKVPETIKSRCQLLRFKRATQAQIIEKLKRISKEEAISMSDADLKKIASASMGGYRDAETLFQQVVEGGVSVEAFLSAGAKYRYLDLVNLLLQKDSAQALSFVNSIYEEGIDLYIWTGELLNYLRGLLFVKSGVEDYFIEFGPETVEDARVQSANTDFNWIVQSLETLLNAQREIRAAFIPQLPLEIAISKICDSGDSHTTNFTKPAKPSPVSKSKSTPSVSNITSSFDNHSAETRDTANEDTEQTNLSSADTDRVESQDGKCSLQIPLNEIQEKWGDLCNEAAKINNSISALLKSAKLTDMDGKFLVLEVFYSFHKERIESSRNRKVIEDVIKEVIGFDLSVKCVVSKQKKPKLNPGEVGELTDINVAPVALDPKAVLDMLDGGLPLIQNA